MLILRGFAHLVSSVGLVPLLGSSAWFSQSLMRNAHSAAAYAQVGLESRAARINWLLPLDEDDSRVLPALLDNLSLESALRGSHCLLTAAHADSVLFQILRNAGFCVYGWQRIWHVARERFPESPQDSPSIRWSKPDAQDVPGISSLRRQLLSPSVQTVKKITGDKLPDTILKINGEVQAIARVNGYGRKAMVAPLFAPGPLGVIPILQPLFARLFPLYPTLFLVQTGDTAALDETLSEIADPLSEREELLVKHFTSLQKIPLSVLNTASHPRHADTIAPIMKFTQPPDHL